MRNVGVALALATGVALLASALAACGEGGERTPLRLGVMLVNSGTRTETALDWPRAL